VALSRRRDRRILHQAADAIITTSQGSDRILRTFLGADLRTHVIPNFTPDVSPAQNPSASNSRWLAMGRFSPEKGFAELIQSWPEGPALDVIGDGPLRSQLMDMARARRVSIKPVLPLDELREVLSAYVGLVFPSTWFDVAPQVVSEAMRVGLPVVALATNTVADVVNATGSGATYLTDAELARAIRQVESNRPDMSRAARACYESNWTERAWLSAVDSLYADVAQLPLG
jgi:glycosyltransferase involved in cell wall biosynthesis